MLFRSLHKNSEGVFRFEIQLHREVLKKRNLRCLTHVTAKKVMEIVESRFNKSRLGLPFSINGGLSNLCQALESKVSAAKANGFLGVALRMSNGMDSGCNPKTLADYKSLGESIGFALGSPLDSLGSSQYSLNWKTGVADEVA